MLGEATTLLSGLSHCAGVVVTPKINARLKHIEFVNLAPGRALVILVGEDGGGRKPGDRCAAGPAAVDLHPGLELSVDAIPGQDHRRGAALRARGDGEPARASSTMSRPASSRPASAIWSGDSDPDDKTLIVKGQANLIENATAVDDLERIRRLFEDIENKKELVQLLGPGRGGRGGADLHRLGKPAVLAVGLLADRRALQATARKRSSASSASSARRG